MIPPHRLLFAFGLLTLSMGAALSAPAPASPGKVDYARDVRPLLRDRCYACHGGGHSQGGFRLDSREETLRGGDSGAAVKPGHATESLLARLVAGADPKRVMPPAGPRLTPAEVKLLRDWIDQGATWESNPTGKASATSHWAFQPITRPVIPAVRMRGATARNPIDAFVLARLEKERLRPSAEADPVTLIRRLSMDLLGLPPTPEEVDAFVRECGVPPNTEHRTANTDAAYRRLVDRLLASPHFGERWGRHWLDLARYADSDGYEKDLARPYAYLYRDWVIDAINRDVPFDQFTLDQLAGDLEVQETLRAEGKAGAVPSLASLPEEDRRKLIATGFHRNTLKNREGGVDQEEDRVKITVDRANTTGTVWLGLTVGCAQCHSHKYDPITQREYYGLYAFFNSAQEVDQPLMAGSKVAQTAQTLLENPKPPQTHVLIRGDFLRPGDPVQPHVPAVLPTLAGEDPNRLTLARWLVDPKNPLTARVAVNRVWQHLFGQGLVTTPDDFGLRGARPTHPELLDYLATAFVTGAETPAPNTQHPTPWSLKSLVRLLVTSATYRQASTSRPDLEERDPRNALLARQSRFRPEAEIVRDLYLSASGLLNAKVGGPSIRPPLPGDIAALGYASSIKWEETKGAERYRRGMYIFFQRTVPYPQLVEFDAPDGNNPCTRRERSNTPLQALTLLNDPVFVECAQALGRRLAQLPDPYPDARVRQAFRSCVSRNPSPAEAARLKRLYTEMLPLLRANPIAAAKLAGKELPAGLDPAETAAWVTVARTVLNLDEFITRE